MAGSHGTLTILIAARNASATIERAVASCLPEPHCPVLLADDGSTDDTVAQARRIAGDRLRVVCVPGPGGVARARQVALDETTTPLAAWLDADDEWIPGRAARLIDRLEDGYDVATESIDLYDGPTGQRLRRLDVPSYLRRRGGCVRLFERNHLPGDTQVAFRTAVFRDAGGYDPAIEGPESYDILLRAVRRGARVAVGDEVGYRMFAYPASLSRHMDRQRTATARVLRQHAYDDIRQLYRAAEYGDRITAWALVMVAQWCGDASAALRYLDEACPVHADPDMVLEPDGPWPHPEGWRRAFHRGTILLQGGGRAADAAADLQRAESLAPSAEGANNLGVALARLGQPDRARACVAAALSRFPGYLDATLNASEALPSRVTTHPLRRIASRHEYESGMRLALNEYKIHASSRITD